MTDNRPIIAITMGDASGIGPEVIAKALDDSTIFDICRPLIIGDARIMQKSMKIIQSQAALHAINSIAESGGHYRILDILDLHNLDDKEVITGHICKACGRASIEYVIRGAQLALDHEVAALVTAPINKEATRLAGYGELGHLELLSNYTHTAQCATMLASGSLRVVHLTTHYPLRDALAHVTKENILDRIQLTYNSFRSWGFEHPRIGVSALNPHGGEGGIMGREELDQIFPAIQAATKLGIDARGPYPADTIFNRAIQGEFDVVIAMYHDQGHIPIKVHGFEKSVSIALGLPFIRTSVDHGTAFDIAGKGVAEAESMQEAIKVAVNLSLHQKL